ncbi:uncharacterized protein VP01_2436g4 [Puccinia sorghi]|uniref:Retrovirus-related Pol polyprotein from transposon TNT 1-94-like beta-barrel domain-containing protein n=1 Tax=Puccinia sorghi TaxID=27349 RepID=A0A0L6V6G5_9BASI|nr:uncharacterized protein VP01_2436g4 [Puccinia sorghi]
MPSLTRLWAQASAGKTQVHTKTNKIVKLSTEQSIQYSISNMSNTTFATWKTQVLAYCMEYNLDNFLLRDIEPPPSSEADKLELYESWCGKAAGVLVHFMGQLWTLLTNHYNSKAAANQAKVYQAFCNYKFSKDLPTFFDDLNSHLSNMTSVGLQVGIPEKIHIHKHLLSKQIIQKLPKWLNTIFNQKFWIQQAPSCLTLLCRKQSKAVVNGNNTNNESSVPSNGCLLGISKQQAFSAHTQMNMFLDSGFSDHMFPKKEYFTGYKSISSEIEIANGKSLKVEGSGYVQINDGHGYLLKIKALHFP